MNYQLSKRASYLLMAGVIGIALFASATPSPLYPIYSVIWSLSPVVLTLVYATYAIGVLTTLLLAGPVSDHVGRRPVLLTALAALMVSSVIFMLASSVAWLFVARALQGLATGLVLSAASAALLDLHPHRDPRAVGLHNGTASAAGLGIGALVSATIVQLLPAQRVLPYLTVFVLFAAATAAIAAMPEPVATTGRLRLRPQRPAVPAVTRQAFVLAALGVLSSWSIGGLSLALGPQLLGSLFHTNSELVGGLSVVVLTGAATVSQVIFRSSAPWAAAAAGSVALAAGLMGIVLAAAIGSGALYLISSVVGGAGFGVAFLGALRALSGAIPPEHRSAVMSAFYTVAYLSLSVPAIAAGVLVTPLGLAPTFEIFGSVIAGVALIVAALAWRTRPRAAPLAQDSQQARPRVYA